MKAKSVEKERLPEKYKRAAKRTGEMETTSKKVWQTLEGV